MSRISSGLKALVSSRWLRWLAIPAAAAAVVGTVLSQTAPPNIPAVSLAAEPLYARGARAKPTLTLALSVEFPTVGAQYVSTPGATSDATYSTATKYIGYFDSESCYVYNDTPTETRPTGVAVTDYKRFDRSGAATSRTCGGTAFSGNFMNWATSSAIDILRYGLTGGDRVVDTTTLTVLQRAVLRTGFWNSSNFPDKQLSSADAPGAMPTAVLGGYTGTVHIANCLNRIHFGTTATGSCAAPGNNSNLGTTATVAAPRPSGFTLCVSENATCTLSGTQQVIYGADLTASGGTGAYAVRVATGSIACNNATFGDPVPGTAKSCYYRPVPATQANFTSDGYYFSRVSVCASSSGTLSDPRTDLCLRYPSGSYKPVGNLQKYSDRLRVAAFGYLNDSTGNPSERYGGVLRAPMKYVGPTYYNSSFSLVSGANPNQEWDSTTGVLVENPDGNASIRSGPTNAGPYLSGVINYLNQFGRTGVFGDYKTYDPVGELYYEALRYIQGLPPTPQATANMTPAMQDGFPVTTAWTDPHPAVTGMSTTTAGAYSCVRNNIVAIGDVNTHNDKSFPGNTTRLVNENATTVGFPSGRAANLAGNEPNFVEWTRVVGGFESNTSVSYLDGNGASQTTSNFNTPIAALANMDTMNIGSDGAAYFMAGAAYWANTHDIRGANWTSNWPSSADPRRPGMRVTTYVLDVNEYGNQSVTATRRRNQFFLASKYGGFDDVSGTGNPFKAKDLTDTNVNWQDPAAPGEAKNYFLSSSASSVLAALNQIFANIASQANSIAGGAISTQRLSSVPGAVYQAQFDAASWSGDLAAYPVSADSSGNVTIGDIPLWQAAIELNAKAASTAASGVPGGGSRNIVIGKTTATSTAAATNFLWSSVDTDVKTALLAPPYGGASATPDPDATGQARLNYLRGDRSNEAPSGLLMRQRSSVMGDIVNSAVVFSGAPSSRISDADYPAFVTTNASRKRALFVGANDGMLHAFDADHGSVTGHTGGDELFAYIPSWMIPKLGALTSPSYVHQSYVDSSPAVAEAKVGTTWSSATWKTVLVGGTGGGGQGVYALDVTNPDAFDASKVMWEFSDRDDPDMGNVIGKPQILKLRTTASTATTVDYQYFAVVASGVNNYVDDGRYSTTGNPALFLLDLSKPKGAAWALNSNYYKISFPALTSSATGMLGFTARLGAADAVSAIYAGDLQGNMWKLDFAGATGASSTWSLATLSYFKDGSNNPLPMYVAKNAAGTLQPITMEPSLVYGPNRSVIVAFGTGKFLEASDNVITGAPQQSVYSILDNNDKTLDSGTSSASAIAGRSRLAVGTSSSGTITVPAFTWGRSMADTDSTGVRSGWYFDFPNTGERQISDFAVLAGQLIYGSVIPAANSCDNGNGYLYITDIATGATTSFQSTVGILGEPMVTQVGASTLTVSDTTGQRKETARYQIILQGSGGLAAPSGSGSRLVTSYVGRLSWREISNYQQLRNN